jgi:hypothetical protein
MLCDGHSSIERWTHSFTNFCKCGKNAFSFRGYLMREEKASWNNFDKIFALSVRTGGGGEMTLV